MGLPPSCAVGSDGLLFTTDSPGAFADGHLHRRLRRLYGRDRGIPFGALDPGIRFPDASDLMTRDALECL